MGNSEVSFVELFWYLVFGMKLRLGWLLYNTVYIYIFRIIHVDGSFGEYSRLVFEDIYEKLGLDYDEAQGTES